VFCPVFFSPLDVKSLEILLECLTRLDLHYLYQNPNTPPIYESGVVYERESASTEEWLTIPEILARGVGDCEDLACWRAAEYRYQGIQAHPFVTRMPTRSDRPLYHVRIRLANGRTIEDPSRELGMAE
jgi:hypothetical protein